MLPLHDSPRIRRNGRLRPLPCALWFKDVISGRRRGPAAWLARGALRVAEAPYTWAVGWRNDRYDRGRLPIERVEIPVISVGNLTLGGTGKTPLVAWIARWLRQRGARVAIISRGYKAGAGGVNDEALELETALPDVPHVQDADRVAGARMAALEFESQVLILDDGFQHRRLARDLDIVLLDALEPTGWGHVFPRGTLREPLAGLGRAHVVALSRADAVSAERRAEIEQLARRLAPQAAWVELAHRPRQFIRAGGEATPLEALRGRRVAAFCGIGNPDGFRHTLATLGVELVGFRAFDDHHHYQRRDVEELAAWAESVQAEAVVCTCKDFVKLAVDRLGRAPLSALEIEIEMLAGRDALEAKLLPLVPTSE